MKTKNVLRILAIAFAMVLMLAIASCDLLLPEVTTTAHVHSETVLAAVEATCTETGLTEGKKCTTCGQVTVPQQVVPAKGHTEEVVAAVEATCTSIGLTEGKKCSVCDVTLKAQDIVPAKGHTPKDVAAIPATCTQKGLTAGKVCSECDTILEAQELTDALGHTPGAAATCTTNQTCTVCKAELAPANGHDWGTEVTTVTAPTCAVDGKGTVKCKNCDATKEQVIPATGNHTWDAGVVTVVPSCAPGERTYTCTVCGDKTFEVIQATGAHTYGEAFVIYPATCTSEGLKGKTCSTCNVTVKAGRIDPLKEEGEHVYVDGKCSDCGTCKLHSYEDYMNATTANDPLYNDRDHSRFDFQWGICEDCGYVHKDHEHLIKGGECYYCEYVYSQVTHRSAVDNDGDGFGDIYYFAPALPERFRAEGTYMIDAKNDMLHLGSNHSQYDVIAAGPSSTYWVSDWKGYPLPYAHIYVTEKTKETLDYEITVEKAGTYEVAIYFRVKDVKLRGSTFTINEGTPSEYSFEYTYGWDSEAAVEKARNNQFLIGGYMIIEMDLHEGKNTIKVSASTVCPKSQHYRAFFFALKEEKHVHAYAEEIKDATCLEEGLITYTCACGDVQTRVIPAKGHEWGTEVTTVTAPTCGVDGKGTVKCNNCDATEERVIPATLKHTVNEETFKCTVCEKDFLLTLEEAIALGNTFEKDKYSEEIYWVELTLNHQANADGFARASTAEGILFSVKQYQLLEGQEFPKKGDTILFRGKIGAVNSATQGKEGRLFEAQIVKVVAECDHAAGWIDATCAAPKTCKTCGRTEGEKNENHVWKDATCVAPKTCSVCGATEGEAAEGHQLDENYKCTVCEKNFLLTPAEAHDIALAFKDTSARSEEYYIIITLDDQVNENGFGRGSMILGKKYMTVAGPYVGVEEGETMPVKGDTVILKGVIGKTTSTRTCGGYEARLYNVTLVKNLSANCGHDWVAATCTAPETCSKCKAVRAPHLDHDVNENYVCKDCGANMAMDVDQAIAEGQLLGKHNQNGEVPENAWSADYYYVTVKFNNGAPSTTSDPVGFCRVLASDNTTKLAIKNIAITGDQTLPVEGDTVVLRAKIAQLKSGEIRLYDVTLVEVVTPAQ